MLVTVLQPFQAAQQLLEGEKYITNSFVVHMVATLRTGLQAVVATAVPLVAQLAQRMLDDFNVRWGTGIDGSVVHANNARGPLNRQVGIPVFTIYGAALDPRTKSLTGMGPQDKVLAWGGIKQFCMDAATPAAGAAGAAAPVAPAAAAVPVPAAAPVAPVAPAAPAAAAAAAVPNFIDAFDAALLGEEDDGAGQHAPQLTLEQLIDSEILRYRSEPVLPRRSADGTVFNDPLEWWKARAHSYPHLQAAARKVLCIPATSAPSERVFSQAGLTIANQRARMLPQNANNLVFLHDGWPAMEQYERFHNE